jgi:hypothetical protein
VYSAKISHLFRSKPVSFQLFLYLIEERLKGNHEGGAGMLSYIKRHSLTYNQSQKMEKAQPFEIARLLNVRSWDRLVEEPDQEKYFL